MQFINDVKQKVAVLATENASTLLTAGGVVGTVATGVLAGRGGYKFAEVLRQERIDVLNRITGDQYEPSMQDPDEISLDFKTKAKLAAIWFGPPVLTGTGTIFSIVMANRMSAQKAAALAAAYGLAERNLSEYKEKVAEKLTGPKQQQINEELAQEAVNRTPGHDKLVIIEGESLCLDKSNGRYFNTTMEKLRQAANTTNQEIYLSGYAQASVFYKEIGLPSTAWADSVGFDMDTPCELTIDTVLAPGNRPCLVFEFKYMPKTEFGPKYD